MASLIVGFPNNGRQEREKEELIIPARLNCRARTVLRIPFPLLVKVKADRLINIER